MSGPRRFTVRAGAARDIVAGMKTKAPIVRETPRLARARATLRQALGALAHHEDRQRGEKDEQRHPQHEDGGEARRNRRPHMLTRDRDEVGRRRQSLAAGQLVGMEIGHAGSPRGRDATGGMGGTTPVASVGAPEPCNGAREGRGTSAGQTASGGQASEKTSMARAIVRDPMSPPARSEAMREPPFRNSVETRASLRPVAKQ